MEKAGLKTFVYSFVFSLFTLFGANSVYLRSKPASHDIKISNKNVTLFLKSMPQSAPQAYAAPVKKIALSVMSDITPPQRQEEHLNIPLGSDDAFEENSPLVEADIIPLEGSVSPKEEKVKETQILLADASLDAAERISENFEEIIKSAPPVVFSPPANQNEESSDELESEPFANITDDISLVESVPPKRERTAYAENIIPAPQQTAPSSNEADRAPVPLIPIEKENGIIRTANKTIEIVNAPAENQVALKSDNIPIKSMSHPSPKDLPATYSREWQQMSQKQEANTDDAWLVAKSKNPQNNLITETDSYKKNEKEIRQLLSAEISQTPEGYKPIELAAETPKNLLIPIPEEILQDENLTPQLTSSPRNKAIEEKLHNESDDDRFRDDYIDDAREEEKKGLLDSLTSIFSNKEKNTPEIGNSVEDESKGLFSAFKQKRSRSKNNAKILPTEMRLSFQPNRAEISGQTLRWIRAFANKTRQEKTTGLEIRIDGTSSPLLQQRRLNLLQNILIKENVDQSKVNTVFTAREPNSFIIRTIRVNIEAGNAPAIRRQRNNERYQQW